MKKIFNTIILSAILLTPFSAPADAASVQQEELSPERISFMCSVGTGPCPTTKPVEVVKTGKTNATSTEEESDVNVSELKIKELKDRIVQLQIQLLNLKIEQLRLQLKK